MYIMPVLQCTYIIVFTPGEHVVLDGLARLSTRMDVDGEWHSCGWRAGHTPLK